MALLLEQLFGYFRDCMAAAVGCPAETFLYASPRQQGRGVRRAASGWACRRCWRRCRSSTRPSRDCATAPKDESWPSWPWCGSASLEDLDELAGVDRAIACGRTGPGVSAKLPPQSPAPARTPAASHRTAASPRPRKSPTPAPTGQSPEAVSREPPASQVVLTSENAPEVWSQALSRVSGLAAEHAKHSTRDSNSCARPAGNSVQTGVYFVKVDLRAARQVAKFQQVLSRADRTVHSGAVCTDGRGGGPKTHRATPSAVSPQQRIMEVVGASDDSSGGRIVRRQADPSGRPARRRTEKGRLPGVCPILDDHRRKTGENRDRSRACSKDLAASVRCQAGPGDRRPNAGLNSELRLRRTTGSAGGGMVEIEVNGLLEVLRCRIDQQLVEQGDREMIEDLVSAAVGQAIAKGKELHVEAMKSMTGGLEIPGLEAALGDFLGKVNTDESVLNTAVSNERELSSRAGTYAKSVSNLIDEFAKLPGIGKKSAERLAYHMLRAPSPRPWPWPTQSAT